MKSSQCKNVYFLFCLVLVIGLSAIRSYPVYGKLDFILLEGRPWWPSWRPMIEQLLQQGEQPILSDMMTSTVLRAVFSQKAVSFRFDHRYARIDVATLLAMNSEQRKLLPVGGLPLLLDDESGSAADRDEQQNLLGKSIIQMMTEVANAATEKQKYPYRCLINLHGFTPSWVPRETRHWSWKWSEPSLMYEFKGKRGKDMELLLRDDPPENCTVYF